jgi:putative transposase
MELSHTLNRGVDKRDIFLDKQDYLRFIHDLYELNNKDNVYNGRIAFNRDNEWLKEYVERDRDMIVDVHAFCLMPNHYHLLLSPRIEDGISLFMKKVNIAYAKYFNQKYNRVGTLFQGRYKSVPVKEESHFLHLPYYIHSNPLDLIVPEWRMGMVPCFSQARDFLMMYRWSSFLDYAGIKNFPSVISREFLQECFGSTSEYMNDYFNWLKDLSLEDVRLVTLEPLSLSTS